MRFANPQAARVCVRGCKGRRPERDQRGRSGGTLFRIETIILTRNHRPLQKTAAGLRRGWKSTSWRWDRGKVLEVESMPGLQLQPPMRTCAQSRDATRRRPRICGLERTIVFSWNIGLQHT